jgi:hypothetical protein
MTETTTQTYKEKAMTQDRRKEINDVFDEARTLPTAQLKEFTALAKTEVGRAEQREKIRCILVNNPKTEIKELVKMLGVKREQILKRLDEIGESQWSPFEDTRENQKRRTSR